MSDVSKMKVLYLSRWYPNKFDPMPGLFIQKHAEAANLFCDVGVVYVQALDFDSKLKGYDVDFEIINNVPTAKVYYRNTKIKFPILTQFLKIFKFYKANFIGIKQIDKNIGGFNIIHIHILTRLGIIGLFYKWFFGKKFIVSEHWSRYLELTGDFKGGLRKFVSRIVVKNASAVTTVTENLAKAMQKHSLKNNNYIVLPNVVSPEFLNVKNIPVQKRKIKNIVHVSCFEDKSKNVSGILRVVEELAKSRNDFHFTMVGDGMDFEKTKRLSSSLGLTNENIEFTGLLEGNDLVQRMKNANLLLIFSNYENFPVVINESFSLGIPVIATRVGGIPEYVNADNGILINPGDERSLFNELNKFLNNEYHFDHEKIKQNAIESFSIENVGRELFEIYSEI
jgi:glycosyltransferase involved in cell wall biosynthesis